MSTSNGSSVPSSLGATSTFTETTVMSGSITGPAGPASGAVPIAAARAPFPEPYLLAYSGEHVAYEVDMFFAVVEMIAKRLPHGALAVLGNPRHVEQILLESGISHLRNLDLFLFDERRKFDTDVMAFDFFTSPAEWVSVRPARSTILTVARDRASKELAHLTSSRMAGTPTSKQWNFDELANEIRPVLRAFVNNALPSRLASSVGTSLR